MMAKKKSRYQRHKAGLWFAAVICVLAFMGLNAYSTFQASFEAEMAVMQLEDSVVTYSLVQQLLHGNLGYRLICLVSAVLVIIGIGPFIKGVMKDS